MAYETETDNLLARLAGTLTTDHEIAWDNLFYNLKDEGVYSLAKAISMFRNHGHAADSNLNIVEDDHNITWTNAPSFNAATGWTLAAASQQRGSWDIVPSIDTNIDLSNFTMGVKIGNQALSGSTQQALFGTTNSSNTTALYQSGPNGIRASAQSADQAYTDSPQPTLAVNQYHSVSFKMDDATTGTLEYRVNGVTVFSQAGIDQNDTLATVTFLLGAANNNGAPVFFADVIFEAAYVFDYLTEAQEQTMRSEFEKFFTEIVASDNTQDSGGGAPQILAHVGARGFGRFTIHGRDAAATHYRVTNTNDSGAGSLRAALEASGPRYILFETSGLIALQSNINIADPYVRICGEVTPSPGIFVANYAINIRTHDVLIRHMTFMLGQVVPGSSEDDSLKITSSGPDDIYNVHIDHCTVLWGVDENVGNFQDQDTRVYAVSYQHCIFATPLLAPDNSEGKNVQVGTDSGGTPDPADIMQLSFIECMFINGKQRNPLIKKNCHVEMVNCWIHNYGNHGIDFGGNLGLGLKAHVIRCLFSGGPETAALGDRAPYLFRDTDNTLEVYSFECAIHPYNGIETTPVNQEDLVLIGLGGGIASNPDGIQTVPVLPAGYDNSMLTVEQMKSQIPDIVGATPWDRHIITFAEVNNALKKGGKYKKWTDLVNHPVIAENAAVTIPGVATATAGAWDLPANPNDDSGDGTSNLDVWLEGFAQRAAAEPNHIMNGIDVITEVYHGDQRLSEVYLGEVLYKF